MQAQRGGLTPRLYQRVFEALAADIADGTLRPGAPLTETAVATRFGISRAPARQALAELERLGLVHRRERSGYEVSGQGASGDLVSIPRETSEVRIRFLPSWESIYAEVETEIVSRTSLADWRINEALLARHHGVSRTVARDVVARLQQRGIVRKDDKGRWYAPALTAKHIDELYELRWVLEPLALEKAFPLLPEGLLPRMKGNLEVVMNATSTGQGSMLDALEQELHVELLGHCGNESLMRAISLPQALLVAHHFLYRWTTELYPSEPFLPEHLEIVDRLLDSDVAGAKEALARHLRISRQRAMTRIAAVASIITPAELSYLERLETK